MTTNYLHGAELIEVDSGPRPISTVRTSVIGLVGTAPDAVTAIAATLVTGSVAANTGLTWTSTAAGTQGNKTLVWLRDPQSASAALAVTVSGRLITVSLATDAEGDCTSTAAQVLAAVAGLATAAALVTVAALSSSTGAGAVVPGVKAVTLAGGVDAALPLDTPVLVTDRASAAAFGKAGTIPAALDGIWDQGGAWIIVVRVAVGLDDPGTLANVIGDAADGTGVHALADAQHVTGECPRLLIAPGFTDEGAVVSEMIGIAQRLKAIVIADGPNTTDAAAIAYRGEFGSDRVYLVDPQVVVLDPATGVLVEQPASPRAAGMIARTDAEKGFGHSPSNQEMLGIVGTARPIGYVINDPLSRANLLNASEVTTIIRENGYRLWGDRTCSGDPKFAFLNVRRTADIIGASLIAAHQWAIDRNLTKTYFEDVAEGVNNFLREQTLKQNIAGGRCWVDPAFNTPDQQAQGHAYFDFDFTAYAPAERLTFRSHMVNDYLEDIVPVTA